MAETNMGEFEDILDADISAIGGNQDDLYTENVKLRQDLEEARNQIQLKENQLNSQRKITKGLETQTKMQGTRITRLEDTIKDLKEQIDGLKENPSNSAISAVDEAEISRLNAEITDLNAALRDAQEKHQRDVQEFERKIDELNKQLAQKQKDIETVKSSPSMAKSTFRRDDFEKDQKIQAQNKEIASFKETLNKQTLDFKTKLNNLENSLNESKKLNDGLRQKCKQLEEKLKQAASPSSRELINQDASNRYEQAHPEGENERDEDVPAYNPHKNAMDNVFSYLDQVHDIKEKMRFINYITYVAESKLEEMSASLDY